MAAVTVYSDYGAPKNKVPCPGIEPGTIALRAPNFSYYTTREVPISFFLKNMLAIPASKESCEEEVLY